jgi:hypothetical protein
LVAYDRLAYAFGNNRKALDEACMVQIDSIALLKDNGRKFIELVRSDTRRKQPNYVHDIEVLFTHYENNRVRLFAEVKRRMSGHAKR